MDQDYKTTIKYNIKRVMADTKPIIASIKGYKSFMHSFSEKVWNGDFDNMQGSHAICLIGNDDKLNNGDGTRGAIDLMANWRELKKISCSKRTALPLRQHLPTIRQFIF